MYPDVTFALLAPVVACAAATAAPVFPPAEQRPAIRIERLELQLDGGTKYARFSDLAAFDERSGGHTSDVLVDASLQAGRFRVASTDRRNLVRIGGGSAEAFAALVLGLESWGLGELEAAARATGLEVEEDFTGYWSPLKFEVTPGMVFAVRDDSWPDGGIGALVRVAECGAPSKLTFSVARGPSGLFTAARIQVAEGAFERARETLERAIAADPTRLGPAFWLASIGGRTEPLGTWTEDPDWYSAVALARRGDVGNLELRILALDLADDDPDERRRWCEALFSEALADRVAGRGWAARDSLLHCTRDFPETTCGRWSRELLERDRMAHAELPALAAPRVDGFLETLDLLRSTSHEIYFFREFVEEYFAEDPIDGCGENGAPRADLDRGRNDYYGELLALTRRSSPRWEMLRDAYLHRGIETPAGVPLDCVRTWVVLRDLWRELGAREVSADRKCAIVRLLPLLGQIDAWFLAARAADAAGEDELVADVLAEIVGQNNFSGWGDAPFLELLFTEERAPELIEAYLRLPGRVHAASPMARFLELHRTEPRFVQPAERLLQNGAVGVLWVSKEEVAAGELLAALEGASLPSSARVGFSYPHVWDSSGSRALEVRCLPQDLEATWDIARAVLEPLLGEEGLEKRFYRSYQPDSRW